MLDEHGEESREYFGIQSPISCPNGAYCEQGTEEPEPCPDGKYADSTLIGLESDDQCLPCPTGYWCIDGKYNSGNEYLCPAGYYCLSGAYREDISVA